jgi:hypothetical protein
MHISSGGSSILLAIVRPMSEIPGVSPTLLVNPLQQCPFHAQAGILVILSLDFLVEQECQPLTVVVVQADAPALNFTPFSSALWH